MIQYNDTKWYSVQCDSSTMWYYSSIVHIESAIDSSIVYSIIKLFCYSIFRVFWNPYFLPEIDS